MDPRAAARRNIRLLYTFWFLREFQIWIPVWVVFLTIEQDFSLTQVLAAEGLYLIAIVALEVPTGAVADRWGRSRSLALGAACAGGAVLIFAFTTAYPVLIASFLLWGVADALMSGADQALLFDTLRASRNEASFERVAGRGIALLWTGAAVATLLGGPVAAVVDTRFTILVGAGTCGLTALVALSLWEAPHRRDASAPHEPYLRSIGLAFRDVWRAPEIRMVILLGALVMSALSGGHYIVQPYLVDRDVEVGPVFSLLQVPLIGLGALGALAAPRLVTSHGPLRLLTVIPLAGAALYLGVALLPGLAGFPLLLGAFALGAALEPITGGYLNRRVGSERRATTLSIMSMASSVVLGIMAAGVGVTVDSFGIGWGFIVPSVAAVLAVVLLAPLLLRENRRLARRPPPLVTADA